MYRINVLDPKRDIIVSIIPRRHQNGPCLLPSILKTIFVNTKELSKSCQICAFHRLCFLFSECVSSGEPLGCHSNIDHHAGASRALLLQDSSDHGGRRRPVSPWGAPLLPRPAGAQERRCGPSYG